MSQFDDIIRGDSQIFGRYMDDILVECKQADIERRLNELNAIHENLKFTSERSKAVDNGKSLPFLDLKLIQIDGKISTEWYCKPTDTGLIMNFHAIAPKKYKRNVVQGFIHRIFNATSTWSAMIEGCEKAKAILLKNQYPEQFFEPIIFQTLEKLIAKKEVLQLQEPEQDKMDMKMVFVQYRGNETDKFVTRLKASGAPCKIVLTLRKIKTMLPPLKEKVPKELISNVIYKFKCSGCTSTYVGQTVRHLNARASEHKYKKEAIRKHVDQCQGGSVEIDSFEIVHKTNKSRYFLWTLEALYIRELKPNLNIRDEMNDKKLRIKI